MAQAVPSPQPDPVWFPLTRQALGRLRLESLYFLEMIGLAIRNTGQMIGFVARGRIGWRHTLQQAAFVGIDTLGIALVLCTFAGMVIALQIAKEMVKQGAGNYVGSLVSLAILRELAPILTGFAVIAMAGSAFAAELSTMKITSQVDALRMLHVHPIRYLMLPRVLAGMLILPLMTIITSYAGILGGMFISALMADVNPGIYLDSVWQQTGVKDILATLLKASVFGYVIMIFSTTIGLNTKGGSREVGEATTRAVVWSFVAMALMDYLLTYLVYGSD